MSEEEQIKNELAKLRAENASMWATYGSELCAGEMIREEKKLEEKLIQLKKEAWIKNVMRILSLSREKAEEQYFKLFKND